MTPTADAGFGGMRETILLHARTLPAAPQVLAGLCELLLDPNTDLNRIASDIRLEPTLAARVIRLSNGVAFGGGQRAGSVEEAVHRVGYSDVLRLVGAATVAGLVERSLGSYEIAAERMRESLLFYALASEALAVHSTIDPRTAYSAGLTRGIGMMVLDHLARGRVPPVDAFAAEEFKGFEAWELAKFGTTSPDVTGMILEEWRFPPTIVAAVREHRLRRETGYKDGFACLLNLAGAIVAENGFGFEGEADDWTLTPQKLAAVGFGDGEFRAAGKQAAALFTRQRSLLY